MMKMKRSIFCSGEATTDGTKTVETEITRTDCSTRKTTTGVDTTWEVCITSSGQRYKLNGISFRF